MRATTVRITLAWRLKHLIVPFIESARPRMTLGNEGKPE